MNDRRRLGSVAAWLGAGVLLAGVAMVTAGPLDPPAGPPGSTGKTTDEIYGAIQGIAGMVGGADNCGTATGGTVRTHAPSVTFDATGGPGPTPAVVLPLVSFAIVGENPTVIGGGSGGPGAARYASPKAELVFDAGAGSNYFHRVITVGNNFPKVTMKLGTTGSPLNVELKTAVIQSVKMEMVRKCDGSFVMLERVTLEAGEIRVGDSTGTWNWSTITNSGGE